MDTFLQIYLIAAIIYLLLKTLIGPDNIYYLHLQYNDIPYLKKHENYHPKYCNITLYKYALLRAPDQSRFMIHGLWPERCSQCSSCGYPTFCQKREFNLSSLEPLFEEIHKNWFPGVESKDNTLIKHEWLKHGSCTHSSEIDYFNDSLNLYTDLIEGLKIYECNLNFQECEFCLNSLMKFINCSY